MATMNYSLGGGGLSGSTKRTGSAGKKKKSTPQNIPIKPQVTSVPAPRQSSPQNIPIKPQVSGKSRGPVKGSGRSGSAAPKKAAQPNRGMSYGGGGGGSVAPFESGRSVAPMMDAPVAEPVVKAPSEEDYLKGDAGFQAQQSALQAALQRYLADDKASRDKYGVDYGNSLRDLGYDEGAKAWNWNDQLTASGRGYQNQLNDFASRGMLQSQGYADAFSELQRMLGQQYNALSTGKTTYMNDLDAQLANYRGENTSSLQSARAEALQRRAAQYAL